MVRRAAPDDDDTLTHAELQLMVDGAYISLVADAFRRLGFAVPAPVGIPTKRRVYYLRRGLKLGVEPSDGAVFMAADQIGVGGPRAGS